MKAARYYGKEDIQIKDDVPVPETGGGQVKISPAYVGICGTDLVRLPSGNSIDPLNQLTAYKHEYMGGPK